MSTLATMVITLLLLGQVPLAPYARCMATRPPPARRIAVRPQHRHGGPRHAIRAAGGYGLRVSVSTVGLSRTSQLPHRMRARLLGADAYLRRAVQLHLFQGSVLVARGGTVLLSQGYGLADVGRGVPNTPRTEFRIGSLTKQFTAMAILQLQERGQLSVRDGVCRYVTPCPRAWWPITIHMLLTHTSGIPNYTDFPDFVSTVAMPVTPAQLISRFRDRPLDFAPGTRFRYSNSGYVVLGYIIARVSGEPYALYLQQHILAPLGLWHTGYDQNDPPLPLHATGYAGWNYPAANIARMDMSIPYAAFGLYSTVEDLYRWDQALYTTALVSPSSLNAMFTPYVAACPGACGLASAVGYGYGWYLGLQSRRRVIFHAGDINGFISFVARYPQDRVTIVVLSNMQTSPVVTITERLASLIFGLGHV